MKKIPDPNLLIGFDSADDAAVYRLTPDLCVIHTVDFFPPIVDDPYEFGQIAAANSLSDIYAMGGKPISALNLLCVPNCLAPWVVKEILRGGNEKALEAGVNISGGHSIEDEEPKYGLSVVGIVPEKGVLPNSGAKAGEKLVLTKALGSGILTTADKAEMLSEQEHRELVALLSALNRWPAEQAEDLHPSACTDITGFGLIGHAAEMAEGSGMSIHLYANELPIIRGALSYARDGIIPAGAYANRKHLGERYGCDKGIPLEVEDVAFDPQTSGGLLYSLPEAEAGKLVEKLHANGLQGRIVGEVVEREEKVIRLLNR